MTEQRGKQTRKVKTFGKNDGQSNNVGQLIVRRTTKTLAPVARGLCHHIRNNMGKKKVINKDNFARAKKIIKKWPSWKKNYQLTSNSPPKSAHKENK